jgi:hypothetical protein
MENESEMGNRTPHLKPVLRVSIAACKTVASGDNEKLITHHQHRTPHFEANRSYLSVSETIGEH